MAVVLVVKTIKSKKENGIWGVTYKTQRKNVPCTIHAEEANCIFFQNTEASGGDTITVLNDIHLKPGESLSLENDKDDIITQSFIVK